MCLWLAVSCAGTEPAVPPVVFEGHAGHSFSHTWQRYDISGDGFLDMEEMRNSSSNFQQGMVWVVQIRVQRKEDSDEIGSGGQKSKHCSAYQSYSLLCIIVWWTL